MLRVEKIEHRYATGTVLAGVDLAVGAGEVCCIVGPNGAGKSTLVKCINGLVKPDRGVVMLNGRTTEDYGRFELARTIAYVPQQMQAALSLSVLDTVGLGRLPHRGTSTKARDRDIVWDALKRLGLAAHAFRNVGTLSGGERQRVLLARALAQDGQLILMDEPASNLDPFYQLETASLVRESAASRNVAVLLVLHDLSLAARLADTVVLMQAGNVVARGEWGEVLTTSNLQAVFGVHALVGSERGVPFVLLHEPGHRASSAR